MVGRNSVIAPAGSGCTVRPSTPVRRPNHAHTLTCTHFCKARVLSARRPLHAQFHAQHDRVQGQG